MHHFVTETAITPRSVARFLRGFILCLLPLSSIHLAQGQGEAEHAYLITLDGCTSDDREKAVYDVLVTWGVFVRVEVVRADQQVKMLSNSAIDRPSLEQVLSGANVTVIRMVDLMTGAHIGPDHDVLGSFLSPGQAGDADQSDPAYTLAKRAWLAAHPNWIKEHPDTASEVDTENE